MKLAIIIVLTGLLAAATAYGIHMTKRCSSLTLAIKGCTDAIDGIREGYPCDNGENTRNQNC